MDDLAMDGAYEKRDTRPGLIICVFDDPHPEWDLVEDLSGRLWDPPGARTVSVPFDQHQPLVETLNTRLATPGVRGLLLVGHADQGREVLIPLRAMNRTADGGARAVDQGPGVARATVPAAEMIRALARIGVTAHTTQDDAEGTGGFLLYSVLASVPDDVLAPSVGLVLLPPDLAPEGRREAVMAAATAVATSLAPLPRTAFS
jgi:hypothetical protein